MTKFIIFVSLMFSFQISNVVEAAPSKKAHSRQAKAETADIDADQKSDDNIQQTKALEKAAEPAQPTRAYELNESDREILRRGEMPTGQYVIGGLVGTFVGFGIGQGVESRYYPTGLIITLGEVTSLTMMLIGVTNCVDSLFVNSRSSCNSGLLTAGWFIFAGMRLWEIIDVWAIPPMDDARYRELRSRGFQARPSFGIFPIAGNNNDVTGAGLSMKISF